MRIWRKGNDEQVNQVRGMQSDRLRLDKEGRMPYF